jgi:hypothetical protein
MSILDLLKTCVSWTFDVVPVECILLYTLNYNSNMILNLHYTEAWYDVDVTILYLLCTLKSSRLKECVHLIAICYLYSVT